MNKLILIMFVFLLALPIGFGEEITIFLQSADNETLDDAWTDTNNDINHGAGATNTIFSVGSDRIRTWLTFNMSPVNDQCTEIIAANVSMQCAAGGDCGISGVTKVFEVNQSSPLGAWDEATLTGANNPCGTTDYNKGEFCNQTESDTVTVDAAGWYNWSVTAMVKKSFNEDRGNVSMNFNNDLAGNQHLFHSKEAASISDAPILYVMCEELAPLDSTPPVIQLGVNTSSPKINDLINISFNVTDDIAPIFVNMTINFTTGTTISNYTITADSDLHNINYIINS